MKPKLSPWHSLKTRATVFTLVIFMLGLWSLSFYVSRSLRADMERLLGEQQFSTVSYIAAEVNGALSDRLAALELVAKEIDAQLMTNPAALQARLEQRPILELLFNGGTFVTGPDGTVIADVPLSSGRIGTNYMDRENISISLKEDKTVIGRPVMGKKLGAPVFSLSVPIHDTQHNVVGALVAAINLGKPNFLDKITQSRYGRTGGYFLIAPQHKLLVTATDKSRIMQPVPAPGLNAMHDRYMQGYTGFGLAVSSRGVLELSAARDIPAAGWFVVGILPAQEAFAPIESMQQRMLLTTLLLTLLIGALTWWVLKRQLSPLVATADAMQALADSKQIPQPLPGMQQGEIGQLVAGFNRILQTWTQREAALRDSQQHLAITLNSIGDAVIATDTAGCITHMNPTAEHLTAWKLADALGQPLAEVFRIVNAQTRLAALNPVQSVMERGEVVGLANHTALLARDGREYQIADSAAPIRDAADRIVGVVLVFSDVTEKYEAEEALRLTRFSVEAAADSLFWMTPDGRIVDVNAAACRSLGYTREELLQLRVPDVDAHYNAELWPHHFAELRQRGSMAFESEQRTKDGRLIPVEIVANYVKHGSEEHNCAFVRDITERKQVEAALVASEQRWKFAIEGAGDGLWDWNIQTGRAFYSPRYKAMLGYNEEEIGDTADEWNKRIHPEDAPGVFAAIQPYMEGKPGSATVEFRMLCKDGGWQWTMGRGMVVERDADGRPLRMIGTNSDITERKAHDSQLEHIAHYDALTNLPNRVLLADRLQQAMAQALRRHQQLAVAYLDLDGFKAINDHHGHETGDQVLITLANRMREALREGDTLARLGGDEFVAVLIDLEDASASLPMLDRLLKAAALPVQVGERILQGSASLGVTFYPQAQDIDADQLLRQADQVMYQAKVAGKNRYHVFDAVQDSSVRGHHESLERIRLALAQDEFVLHYQPKVNMHNGKVIGTEALIRWQHPEKGLLAPAAFLPVIEDHPLAVAMGEWVIDTALTQIELWHAAGLDLPVSVNIGARQLQQNDFVERLQAILANHPQLHPGCIELEMLETSALADMAQVSQVIDDCAEIGVKFALDDFGTGYSSLTYLKRLRVAMLKIDQSFVHDMLDDPDDMAILQGVIGLAAAFKCEVIAEGVETVAHGSALLQLGCELAQGYGISRPMPADRLPAWAATWKPDVAWCALPNSDQA